ncbi:hypothetical protein [Microlunatus sp. GCM10028923]|uniref:hypothetical protein n=1 Tax=Microlunatus sp. GCM10028923 TaxID=3273400 RepID=UPI0036180378
MTLRRCSILVALTVALFAGACSGNTPAETGDSGAPSAPASSAAPSSAAPSSEAPGSSAPPSASSDPSGTAQTSRDGVFSWTMPCAKPRSQELTGNDMDELGIESSFMYACGKLGDPTITGAMVATLKKEPSAAEAKQLAEVAISQLAGSKPKLTDAELGGHPGWSTEVERSGRKIALQAVWSGTGVALFFTTPPDALPALLKTVQVKG